MAGLGDGIFSDPIQLRLNEVTRVGPPPTALVPLKEKQPQRDQPSPCGHSQEEVLPGARQWPLHHSLPSPELQEKEFLLLEPHGLQLSLQPECEHRRPGRPHGSEKPLIQLKSERKNSPAERQLLRRRRRALLHQRVWGAPETAPRHTTKATHHLLPLRAPRPVGTDGCAPQHVPLGPPLLVCPSFLRKSPAQ